MEDKRYIKKRYIFINVIMIGLAVLLILLPERYSSEESDPDLLLRELNDNTRFISTDDVARKIINGDRHIQIIDVRSPDDYAYFHLTGAINIPLENLLDKDENGNLIWIHILDQDVYENIFYSNGSVYANQAWMLTRRLNFKNNYVMEGGLNKWFETVIRPKRPNSSASDTEFALYDFRKAASMYFGKGGNIQQTDTQSEEPEHIQPVIKKDVPEDEDGGC
jgi:rhodanese-related sulfurtransferase